MIRISHEHKAIFCHIPRTGGTSIEHVLHRWERVSHVQYGRNEFKRRFIGTGGFVHRMELGYFVFTVVRNPYDRFISGVHHLHKNQWGITQYWLHEHLWATQCEILGDLKPDMILRLESLDEDFEPLRELFGLRRSMPRLNSTSGLRLPSANVIKQVNDNYAEDFERFGYERR